MRFLGVMCWSLIAGMLSSQNEIVSQNFKLLVLDALDGKPQAKVEIEYFCAGSPLNSAPKRALTNNEGFAKISDFCSDKQEIEISVYPPNKKEQCGVGAGMTFNDVVSMGFVSKPDADGGIWCPTKISKCLKPVPGQVTMFVKKPTWWQSHVAG